MITTKIRDVRVERSPKNLSSKTIATTDIYRIQPIMMRETKKNDKWNIDLSQINICDALSVPSFVNVRSFNTFFYVPYCKVWQMYESMMGNTNIFINSNVIPQHTPLISAMNVYDILRYLGSVCTNVKPTVYDFRFKYNNSTYYVTMNSVARRFWTILQGLGYKFNMYFETDSTIEAGKEIVPSDDIALYPSALPLLSYFKIYAENYIPSKYYSDAQEMISHIYNSNEAIYWIPGNQEFTMQTWDVGNTQPAPAYPYGYSIFRKIASMLSVVYYGDDYFTSSPLEAMEDMNSNNRAIAFNDITVPSSQSSTLANSDASKAYTPVHVGFSNGQGAATPYHVSDYIHNMLHVFTKNVQLKALAGSKLAQRLYALYGTRSQTYNMEAVCLGQDVSDVDVKAITSVADTENGNHGAQLGQKGGQLNNYSRKKFHFEFTEFGALICVNAIIPSYFYGEGMHREMMHTKQEDFYNDRFALAGYQNIGFFELFSSDMLGFFKRAGKSPISTFGKTSAYAEYALRKDILMGDMSILSRAEGLDAYHFNRFLVDQLNAMKNDTAVGSLPNLPSNNVDFLKVNAVYLSRHQYDRLFVDSNSQDDHFIQFTEFEISAVRDGRNINDFTIGEDDGKRVEFKGLGSVLFH